MLVLKSFAKLTRMPKPLRMRVSFAKSKQRKADYRRRRLYHFDFDFFCIFKFSTYSYFCIGIKCPN